MLIRLLLTTSWRAPCWSEFTKNHKSNLSHIPCETEHNRATTTSAVAIFSFLQCRSSDLFFNIARYGNFFCNFIAFKPSRVGHFEPAVNSILGTGAHYFALGTCVAYVREMKSPNLLKPLMFSWGKTIIMHKDSTGKHCRLNFWKNPAEIIHPITISCRQFLTFYDFSEQIIGFDTRTKS